MTPRVSLIVISDRPKALPVLLHALVNQTFEAWEALVLDQTGTDACLDAASAVGDPRIRALSVDREGDWGMAAKQAAVDVARGELLAFPNDDAYYCPVYLAQMVAMIDTGVELAYCDWVFDKFGYAPYVARPRVGFVDVGGFVVSKRAFLAVGGFADRGQTGDGQLVERLAATVRHARVPGFFYTKN